MPIKGNGAESHAAKRKETSQTCRIVLGLGGLPLSGNLRQIVLGRKQPPAPCHPNPTADADESCGPQPGGLFVNLTWGHCRIGWLSWPIGRTRICRLQVFNEAGRGEPAVSVLPVGHHRFSNPTCFTAIIAGVNDGNVQLTAHRGGNCGLPTVGRPSRVVLEPKPGLPTDPTNPRAF